MGDRPERTVLVKGLFPDDPCKQAMVEQLEDAYTAACAGSLVSITAAIEYANDEFVILSLGREVEDHLAISEAIGDTIVSVSCQHEGEAHGSQPS